MVNEGNNFQFINNYIFIRIARKIIGAHWLIPLIIAIFVAYLEVNRLVVYSVNQGLFFNTWDALFFVLANPNLIFFVFNSLILFLISDVSIESTYDQMALMKLGSRRKWLLGEIFIFAITILTFVLIISGSVVGMASITLPWQANWSPGARYSPSTIYLNQEILSINPIAVFVLMLLYLMMGWLGFGFFVMLFALLFNQRFVAFSAGILLNFLGLIIYKNNILPIIWELSFPNHMFINLQINTDGYLSLVHGGISFAYWLCWFLVSIVLANRFVNHKDILPAEKKS
ncbi:MAG: hypothetical protein PHQ40_11045 [Anaerolineaceae bacterium]|nr:hypothetical protein [Anaerolineaceae bacterium]